MTQVEFSQALEPLVIIMALGFSSLNLMLLLILLVILRRSR